MADRPACIKARSESAIATAPPWALPSCRSRWAPRSRSRSSGAPRRRSSATAAEHSAIRERDARRDARRERGGEFVAGGEPTAATAAARASRSRGRWRQGRTRASGRAAGAEDLARASPRRRARPGRAAGAECLAERERGPVANACTRASAAGAEGLAERERERGGELLHVAGRPSRPQKAPGKPREGASEGFRDGFCDGFRKQASGREPLPSPRLVTGCWRPGRTFVLQVKASRKGSRRSTQPGRRADDRCGPRRGALLSHHPHGLLARAGKLAAIPSVTA
jgi:hypothetical protein